MLYRQGLTLEASIQAMGALIEEHRHAADDIAQLRDFIAASQRGIAR